MSYCYICGQELKNENDEHVIPSALGGRLKTKNIICSFHNNMLSDLDNYLCQDLTFLTNFVNPHRDNNKNTIPKVKMEYENVDLYRESNGDAKGLYFRADEDNGVLTLDVKLCYSANSEAEKDSLRELKKRLKGVAKQFQKDNAWVEMAYERILAESSVYSAAEPLFSSFTINKSKKLFLSFLKIAKLTVFVPFSRNSLNPFLAFSISFVCLKYFFLKSPSLMMRYITVILFSFNLSAIHASFGRLASPI